MNPLGINLWNWCAGLSEECLGLPEKVARMGFTAVELPMTQPQVPSALADEIRNTGLAVSLCAALGPGRDLSSFDSAVRASTMDYLTTCLETAGQLGAGILAGPLYTGGGKRHWLSPDEKKREWMLAVDGLRELARRAEHYGVVLSVEPLNRYRTSVANTAGQVLQAGKVNHFHACANNRGAPGQGVIPWEDLLGLLVRYGYGGHITMETFALGGLDSSWVQVHSEPDELAREGLFYLQAFFKTKAGL